MKHQWEVRQHGKSCSRACHTSQNYQELDQPCSDNVNLNSAFRQTVILQYTRLMALFPELPRWASTRKVKAIWILLKQETVSGNGISWAICKSAPHSRQITTPAPHHSDFYRPPNQQHQSTVIRLCISKMEILVTPTDQALMTVAR